MGNVVANIAKGSIAEKVRDGANLIILILKTGVEADATLIDYDTVTALLAPAANDEPGNAGYARKTVANASVTLTVDDTNERVDVDIPDQTWTAVAAGDNWDTLVIAEDVGGGDGTRVPLTFHDFNVTTDGNDIIAQIAAAGFFRAS